MSNKFILLIVASIGCLCGSLIAALVWYSAGSQQGTEFSPDTFTRRYFSYNVDPIFGWVLTRKKFEPSPSQMESDLITNGWVQPVVGVQQSWHLISESSSSSLPSAECDARFLTDYLDLRDQDGDLYWAVWNSSYPKLAKILWPLVAQMARDEMYLKIPDVMEFAKKGVGAEPPVFEESLNQLVSDAYVDLGQIDLELGRVERAKFRAQRAIDAKPTSGAKQFRDACQANRP